MESGLRDIVFAFSADHVIHLTGLSKGQLRYWDQLGFFPPQYASDDRRAAHSRIYSFRDVVGLRALSILRNECKVPFQRIRYVANRLADYDTSFWSSVKLYVRGRDVHFATPDSDVAIDSEGQLAFGIFLKDVMGEIKDAAQKLKTRSPSQIGHIARNRFIVRNAHTIAGTRIPTATIRRFSEAGYTTEQIIGEYPTLTEEDIEAALRHEEGMAQTA